jgi:hypothetical protein
MHLTGNALFLCEGYKDTDGLKEFIPCAQAFLMPCEVDDQNMMAKLLKSH